MLTWILQGFLCMLFLYSGICKSILNVDQLVARGQTGPAAIPMPLTRFIGVVEILGAAGIILPWALQLMPELTPITAIGFAVIMMLALPIHYKLKEPKGMAINITVLTISLFVAWVRFRAL